MKKIKSMFRKAIKSAHDKAKDLFAPFVVLDNHGTIILCWTEKQAVAWIAYCGDKCYIMDTYDYKTLYSRAQ